MLVAAFITIPACLVLWVLAMDRVVQNQPIVPAAPRRRVPWTVIDMALVGLSGVLLLSLSSSWNRKRLDLPDGPWRIHELQPDQQIALLTSFSWVAIGVLVAALLICRYRAGSTLKDLGWEGRFVGKDLVWGVGGFVMLIVPMLLMHLLAQMLIRTEETHPFIEMLRKDPRMSFLLPVGIATILVAPLTEEFFFRVLLQGWLERVAVALERGEPLEIRVDETAETTDAPEANRQPVGDEPDRTSTPSDSHSEAMVEANPYQPPISANPLSPSPPSPSPPSPSPPSPASDARRSTGCELPTTTAGRLWPIAISSLLFAAAHVGQGPAPIALFFLALGLGYIYQRTHRILPSLVIHALVNTTAMVQLWQMVRAAN